MSEFFTPDKSLITPDFPAAAHYLGYRQSSPPNSQVTAMLQKAASELSQALRPQAVFDTFDLSLSAPNLTFADVQLKSVNLSQNLNNCKKVVLLAATIGPQVDTIIRRAQTVDAAYASVLQATGAMLIEKFVELLNNKIKIDAANQNLKAHPRFSPGYGDVSLEVQKDFFRLLPCTRIGLSLMDSLIMAPEKSVTAFIGLE